jgi:hypothetical protein
MDMAVTMALRFKVDTERFKQVLADNGDTLKAIAERAKEQGALHHQFLIGDGEALVVDEWGDREQFLGFFDSEQDIAELFQQAGVTERPTPAFWEPLDTPDQF